MTVIRNLVQAKMGPSEQKKTLIDFNLQGFFNFNIFQSMVLHIWH
jgi:hypothetical protein